MGGCKSTCNILVGIGSSFDVDFQKLEMIGTMYDELDAIKHHKHCIGEDMDGDEENTWIIYTDGDVIETEDGEWHIYGDSLTVYHDTSLNEIKVLKSRVVECHAPSGISPMYCANIDRDGDAECYVIPKQYKIEEVQ